MRLKELADRSGSSVASIKFYLREGLLPPGRRITATLAEYDESHLARLRLIGGLRRIVGAPLSDVRALVAMLDQDDADLYEACGRAQLIGLGLPDPPAEMSSPEGLQLVLREMGWVDSGPAETLLAEHVARMNDLGLSTPPELLRAYAVPAALLAEAGVADLETAPRADEVVLRVAVGTHTHSRLFVRMLAVAQAARTRISFPSGDQRAKPQ